MSKKNNEPEHDDIPSKTQIKNEMHSLQALGEKLLTLKPAQLKKMPISDELRFAVEEAHRIKNRSALKRQRQFIGKLMRDIDPEPIIAQFDLFESAHQMQNRVFHHLEELRDQLISGGNDVIGEVIRRYPGIDTQKLRQVVKNAKKEQQRNHEHPNDVSSTQGRVLFRFLREHEQQKNDN